MNKGELILINKETPHSVGATTQQEIVINMIRLNQAALFLSNTDLRIPKIAEEVGYSSVTFFHKQFKELYNDTPYSFRDQNTILKTNH